MKPVIGITLDTFDPGREGVNLPYIESVEEAGGIPILLPKEALPDTDRILGMVDGLLFTGGGDVDPSTYGEPATAELIDMDPARDAFEFSLMRRAYDANVPTLAICRGIQVMSTAFGGKLIQDIPALLPDALLHRQTEDRDRETHEVAVEADSLLADVLGVPHLNTNSFHHQAVTGPLPGELVSTGRTPDGIVEAVEAPRRSFFIGVQWHPEHLRGASHRRLFAALVAAAEGRR